LRRGLGAGFAAAVLPAGALSGFEGNGRDGGGLPRRHATRSEDRRLRARREVGDPLGAPECEASRHRPVAHRRGGAPRRRASRGGHVAAVTGTVADLDEPGEPASVSNRPNAMVLFNPVVITAPAEGYPESASMDHRERVGVDPVRVSPYHQVKKGAPPTIIFH